MPQNTGFAVAAYIAATLLYAGYAWSIWRRRRALERARDRQDPHAHT